MAKRPSPGKCVHCLKDPVPLTWDHVFPKSWYPDTTDPHLYKWQIPSCLPCNKEYGKLEDDLLIRLALFVDPKTSATSGIVPKVLRAINPRYARDEKDRRMRQAKRDKIMRESLRGDAIKGTTMYPGLGEKWGRPLEKQTAITFSKKSLDRLTEKIVRGIFFLEDGGRFIDDPYQINFYAVDDGEVPDVMEVLDRSGKIFAREPGIVVRRAVISKDKTTSIFEIELWSTIKMYASVEGPVLGSASN